MIKLGCCRAKPTTAQRVFLHPYCNDSDPSLTLRDFRKRTTSMTVSTKRPPPIRHPQYASDLTPLPNQDRLEKPWANYYRDLSTGTIGEPNFVDGESPAGVIDGVNSVFTLANAPNPAASLQLFRNGQKLT